MGNFVLRYTVDLCLAALSAEQPVPTSTNKPAIAFFQDGVVLTTTALMTTEGNNATLTIGFRLGCSVMNSAISGLTL